MRMMRRVRITLFLCCALSALALFAASAGAQVEVYATDGVGAPTDFVFGQSNTLALRGTPDVAQPSYAIIRGIDAASSCPASEGAAAAPYAFESYIDPGSPISVPSVVSGVFDKYRDVRFCVYIYLNNAIFWGSYSQVAHFRDPVSSVKWLDVASATSPELPYFSMTGVAEIPGTPAVSFVDANASCPASFAGGNSLTYSASGGSYTVFGEVPVGIGFWRACGYFQDGSGAPLAAQATFSRAPRGGWKPRYKLVKGKLRAKRGKLTLGSATCPGLCAITFVAKQGKKTLAKGSVSGPGQLKLNAKLTAAGKTAARRGKQVRFTLTSTIDESTVNKTVKLRLR